MTAIGHPPIQAAQSHVRRLSADEETRRPAFVQAADPETLLRWSARVLTATDADEVLAEGDE